MSLVHFVAVRLADAIDELHLQRNDRHRRKRLRQQLDRTVHDRVIQDVLVHLGIGHRARRSSCRGACGDRRGCNRVGFTHDLGGLPSIELQRLSQVFQKLLLGRTRNAIGIADADCHLVCQLLVRRIGERRSCLRNVDALEDYILVERAQLRAAALAGERVDDAANLLAFAVALAAIGESGEQGDGEDGLLLWRGHVSSSSC